MTDLHTSLAELLAHYVRLVESGDAGHWDAESEPVVKRARAALDAVQVQPLPGVVWGLYGEPGACLVKRGTEDEQIARYGGSRLYTTPQAPQPADHLPEAGKMVPLTDEQLLSIARETVFGDSITLTRDIGPYEVTTVTHQYRLVARAIERAHGIGGQP